MARAGSSGFDPSESPLEKAYVWGRQGLEVSTRLLQNWLDGHTRQSIEHRQKILGKRLSGVGANAQHTAAIVFGLGVFLTALFVDYNIIHEFWNRALSNEFGEVPPSLASTVWAKSMQVLFATLAVHYLVTHIGHGGRVAYSLFIFLITAFMVIGIGLLWANNSLPAGSKVFGLDVNDSAQQIDQFMKGLGIAPPRKVALPAEVKILKKYELLIWLFSLGVIFLVVASIGAMSLHTAMRGFGAVTGGAVYDTHRDAKHGRALRDEYQRTQIDLQHFDNDQQGFRRAKVADFITAYTGGIVSARFGNGRQRGLLEKANNAAAEVDFSPLGEGESNNSGNVNNIDDYRNRKAATA